MSEAHSRGEADPSMPSEIGQLAEALQRLLRATPGVAAKVQMIVQEALKEVGQASRADQHDPAVPANAPGALTIGEAKAGLAVGLGVPESAIEIIVRA
jgi:hypothetical protein